MTWVALAACHATVGLTVPPRPAVDLGATRIAVVSPGDNCRPAAETILDALGGAGFVIDPSAGLGVEIFACGVRRPLGEDPDGGRTRAHALVVVFARDGSEATILSHLLVTGSGSGAREARQALARDLVLQLDPDPRRVERRVWPNAPDGSARALATRAVHAEVAGDLDEAVRLAQEAWLLDPSPRAAAYVAELEQRRSSEL